MFVSIVLLQDVIAALQIMETISPALDGDGIEVLLTNAASLITGLQHSLSVVRHMCARAIGALASQSVGHRASLSKAI